MTHLGVIDFNKIETFVEITPEDDKVFKISMRGHSKEIILKADDAEEATEWVELITECIYNSKGKKNAQIMNQPKFWKEEYIGK